MDSTLQVLKALSDETRLRLILLLTHGEMCVCDLTAALKLPQSTVSRHLAHLKNAGLVSDRKKRVWSFYRLATPEESEFHYLAALLSQRLENSEMARNDLAALLAFKTSLDRICE